MWVSFKKFKMVIINKIEQLSNNRNNITKVILVFHEEYPHILVSSSMLI